MSPENTQAYVQTIFAAIGTMEVEAMNFGHIQDTVQHSANAGLKRVKVKAKEF